MRIAVGGIHSECNTYSPLHITLDDVAVLRGDDLIAHPDFRFLHASPHAILPTLHARALPSGPLTRDTYAHLKADFLARLDALTPVDGVYLALHGALSVVGLDDAEGDWVQATRAVVGDAAVIAASFDLHGNLSQRVIDSLDLLTAYRTAPHVDVVETHRRAVALLTHCLEQRLRPSLVWVPVPVLLPGERTSTVDEPAKAIYGTLPSICVQEGILDASLLVGYVWADEPRATASAVLTGTDLPLLTRSAVHLAQQYWDARFDFTFGMPTGSIAACVDWAQQATTQPVILADSGDNPTAGGVGDRTDVLRHLLEHDMGDVLIAGVADQPATEVCYQHGVGGTVEVQVGGTLGGTPSVAVTGEVVFLSTTPTARDRQAVVRSRAGPITLVLTARRRPFHHVSDFTDLGLDPGAFHLVVVKSGYLSPELAALANPNLMALSPGAVDQDITRLRPRHVRKPTFPFERDFTWKPAPVVSARSPGRGMQT